MALDPMIIAALIGGAGSLFGGSGQPEYEMTPAELWRFRMAKRLFQEARGRVPGAAPDERMALGEAQGLLGQQAGQMQQSLFAESAGGYGDTGGGGGQGDMLTRLNAALLSQKAQINSQMMMGFLQNKRNDMNNALGMAPQGGGMWQQQGNDLSGIFGELAQNYALRQGMKKPATTTQPGPTTGTNFEPSGGLPSETDLPTVRNTPNASINYGQPVAAGPSPYGMGYQWWKGIG